MTFLMFLLLDLHQLLPGNADSSAPYVSIKNISPSTILPRHVKSCNSFHLKHVQTNPFNQSLPRAQLIFPWRIQCNCYHIISTDFHTRRRKVWSSLLQPNHIVTDTNTARTQCTIAIPEYPILLALPHVYHQLQLVGPHHILLTPLRTLPSSILASS